jgi:hypothetical protein
MGKTWMHTRDGGFLKMDASGFVEMLLPVYETMPYPIMITHQCVPNVPEIIIFYASCLALSD